jgi:hypothetical protein
MRMTRFAAFGAAVGLGVLGLTGCEFSNTYLSVCETSPPSPHPSPRNVSMTIDAPAKVQAGSTFTVTVKDLDVEGQRVLFGAFDVGGGATPSGTIAVGSLSGTTFPVTYQFTATGQPGETITITPSSATIIDSANPPVGLICHPSGDPLATLRIVAPTP